MKIYILSFLVCCCVLLNTYVANALIFNLGGGDFSADTGGSGADLPDASLTMTFEQDGENRVKLTMNSFGLPDYASKISAVWFNVVGDNELTFKWGEGVNAKKISKDQNVSSAGIFDYEFKYNTGDGNSFDSNMTSIYYISSESGGLTVSDFNDLSTNGYPAIMHVNVTGNDEQSGHYVGSAVPIPAAVWLFGSGLIGLVGIRCKKKEQMTTETFTTGERYRANKVPGIIESMSFGGIFIFVGGLLCLTKIGIIYGAPMILYAVLRIIRSLFVADYEIKGDCPYCGNRLIALADTRITKCEVCKKLSLIKDDMFCKIRETVLNRNIRNSQGG